MSRRVLIVELPSHPLEINLDRVLDLDFRYEQVDIERFDLESVRRQPPDLLIVVAYPYSSTFSGLFPPFHLHSYPAPVLAVVARDCDEAAVQLICESADEVIFFPASEHEWRHRVRRVLGYCAYAEQSGPCEKFNDMAKHGLIGRDPAFLRVVEKIPVLAAADIPVLLTGETGTGKELCARGIHALSRRQHLPFVPMDCGSIPPQLLENELFGHIRGAFTSAHEDHKGLVAMAQGGTLFIDEVDSLPVVSQAKLLRLLDQHSYKPLGAARFAHADLRVIAATNRNLEALVKEGHFRADLYYRLNVVSLHLPPLRERRRDILFLARHFLDSVSSASIPARKFFSPAVISRLQEHNWPGNIRELFNTVQAAALWSPTAEILLSHISLPGPVNSTDSALLNMREGRQRAIERFERTYLEEVLRKHHGNITRAAAEACKDRRGFSRLVRKYGIHRRVGSPEPPS